MGVTWRWAFVAFEGVNDVFHCYPLRGPDATAYATPPVNCLETSPNRGFPVDAVMGPGEALANVEFIGVGKTYAGDVVAVDDLNLSVHDGELMVLVGPSGCGKSTSLRMIAGLEEVTSGTLEIGGRVVNQVPPRDRDVAMVFQSYALYPHMTVFENMAFGLRLRKIPKATIESRVGETATLLEIQELLGRKPAALSGGQRQRVAMGRAIVREPSVFLFDEPLSNLDARLRVQMRLELASLHKRLGATMVYVTHDQVEAMTLADRIAIMSEGRLQQCGPPVEVYRHPRNLFVAGFIGSPSMNFLQGDLRDQGGSAVFVGDGFSVPLPRELLSWGAGPATTLGIRPEDMRSAPTGLQAQVEHVEHMGSHLHAYVRLGANLVVVRDEPNSTLRPGAVISLAFDPQRFHLFDEAGINLRPIRPGGK